MEASVSISEADLGVWEGPLGSRSEGLLTCLLGQMEIPLQPGNALCCAYNGLFIYIFRPKGLGSS